MIFVKTFTRSKFCGQKFMRKQLLNRDKPKNIKIHKCWHNILQVNLKLHILRKKKHSKFRNMCKFSHWLNILRLNIVWILLKRCEDYQELHRIPMNPFLSFFISSFILSAASLFICRFLAFTPRETWTETNEQKHRKDCETALMAKKVGNEHL